MVTRQELEKIRQQSIPPENFEAARREEEERRQQSLGRGSTEITPPPEPTKVLGTTPEQRAQTKVKEREKRVGQLKEQGLSEKRAREQEARERATQRAPELEKSRQEAITVATGEALEAIELARVKEKEDEIIAAATAENITAQELLDLIAKNPDLTTSERVRASLSPEILRKTNQELTDTLTKGAQVLFNSPIIGKLASSASNIDFFGLSFTSLIDNPQKQIKKMETAMSQYTETIPTLIRATQAGVYTPAEAREQLFEMRDVIDASVNSAKQMEILVEDIESTPGAVQSLFTRAQKINVKIDEGLFAVTKFEISGETGDFDKILASFKEVNEGQTINTETS